MLKDTYKKYVERGRRSIRGSGANTYYSGRNETISSNEKSLFGVSSNNITGFDFKTTKKKVEKEK